MIRPPSYGPPKKLEKRVNLSVSHTTGWPIYEVAPKNKAAGRHAIYLHGGGWVKEIRGTHWNRIAEFVERSGVTFHVPIYPLAPTGTAGPVTDHVADYLESLAKAHSADELILMGDSAGGQIAASTAIELNRRGLAPLRNMILISPAMDLTLSNPEIGVTEKDDPWLAVPGIAEAVEMWRGDLPAEDDRVSPIYGALEGLGPITIFSGTRDITNPDTRRFVEKARAAGVPVTYHEAEGLIHVYPLLPTPEGQDARDLIVQALN